jgi:hypothetical protein
MTVTTTQFASLSSIVVCPSLVLNPTYTPPSSVPTDYTWGCPPGYLCTPSKPDSCNIPAGPPAFAYYCRPEECKPVSPFTPPDNWGADSSSNVTSYYPLQDDYFNLAPPAFGLSYDIFVRKMITVYILSPDGKVEISNFYTGNWASQTTITDYNPTSTLEIASAVSDNPVYLAKENEKRQVSGDTLRSIFPRAPTVPAMCYNECNNCMLEAERTGKTPRLCQSDSPFQNYLQGCNLCVESHGDPSGTSLKSYVAPQFQQFIDFCSGSPALADTTSSPGAASQIAGPVSSASPVSMASQERPNTATAVAPVPSSTSAISSNQAELSHSARSASTEHPRSQPVGANAATSSSSPSSAASPRGPPAVGESTSKTHSATGSTNNASSSSRSPAQVTTNGASSSGPSSVYFFVTLVTLLLLST